jgi:hypothetical protein
VAKKVLGWSVGRGSSLSAVSRGGATFFGFGGAAVGAGAGAAADGEAGAAADGGAPGVESAPPVGGDAGIGMNGLTRPWVEAGALVGLAAGAGEVVGAGEVAVAGGLAGVCASAPETRRGSAASAPTIQTRSIMQEDLTRQGRALCAARTASYSIKVTNLSPKFGCRRGARFFRPLRCLSRKCKGRPKAAFPRAQGRSGFSLDAGWKPVVAGPPEAGDAETAYA